MNDSLVAGAYSDSQRELTVYLTRLVLRPAVAEELAQTAVLRLLELPQAQRPPEARGVRAWLFRTGTNLAIDHLRRHATRRESLLDRTRERAERDAEFVAASQALHGSEETREIAREHLVVCLACTMRNLVPEQAATLLLVDAYGFAVAEAAEITAASLGQAKHRLQGARAGLRAKYRQTCALVGQRGACHQCVELSEYFGHGRVDPLQGSRRDLDARFALARRSRAAELGPWHRLLMQIVEDLVGSRE